MLLTNQSCKTQLTSSLCPCLPPPRAPQGLQPQKEWKMCLFSWDPGSTEDTETAHDWQTWSRMEKAGLLPGMRHWQIGQGRSSYAPTSWDAAGPGHNASIAGQSSFLLLPCDCWRLGIPFTFSPFPKHPYLPPAFPRGGHGAWAPFPCFLGRGKRAEPCIPPLGWPSPPPPARPGLPLPAASCRGLAHRPSCRAGLCNSQILGIWAAARDFDPQPQTLLHELPSLAK